MRLTSILVVVGCSGSGDRVAASSRAQTTLATDAGLTSHESTDAIPDDRTPPPADEKAATPVDAKVIDIKRTGNELAVTLDRGSTHGITRTWRGEFLNEANRPVGGARFAITRITAHTCVAVVAMSKVPSERVRLYPR